MCSFTSIISVGSRLMTNMWKAWDSIKMQRSRPYSYSNQNCFLDDSPWFGHFATKLNDKLNKISHRCFKAGIKNWNALMSTSHPNSIVVPQTEFQLSHNEAKWCRSKVVKILQLFPVW